MTTTPARSAIIGYNKIYKQRNLNIVYSQANVPAPGPPADFSPFVNAILAANPNILLVSTAFPSVAGMHAALTAAGYKGFAVNFTDYVPGLLDASPQLANALEGAYISSQIVPQEQNTEWTQQESKDLMAVNAKTGGLITLGAAIGYAEAEMFVEQLTGGRQGPEHQDLRRHGQRGQLHLRPAAGRRPWRAAVPLGSPDPRRLRRHHEGGQQEVRRPACRSPATTARWCAGPAPRPEQPE